MTPATDVKVVSILLSNSWGKKAGEDHFPKMLNYSFQEKRRLKPTSPTVVTHSPCRGTEAG